MAITTSTQFQLTIFDDGQVQLRRDTVYTDGTDEVFRKFNRQVLVPGQDVSTFPARVRNICAAAWPQSVIDAWNLAHPKPV